MDRFDQVGLFGARRVEFEGAGLLAKLGDLHGRELLARERGLGRGKALVALLAVLLLALTTLATGIGLGRRALGTLGVAAILVVATGLLAGRLLLDLRLGLHLGLIRRLVGRIGRLLAFGLGTILLNTRLGSVFAPPSSHGGASGTGVLLTLALLRGLLSRCDGKAGCTDSMEVSSTFSA